VDIKQVSREKEGKQEGEEEEAKRKDTDMRYKT